MHEAQVQILKKLGPEGRLRAATRLYWSARALKAAALAEEHPDWSAAEVEKAVKEAFFYART